MSSLYKNILGKKFNKTKRKQKSKDNVENYLFLELLLPSILIGIYPKHISAH